MSEPLSEMQHGHEVLSPVVETGYALAVVGLVLGAGLMSGLTLGLLSLDVMDLEVNDALNAFSSNQLMRVSWHCMCWTRCKPDQQAAAAAATAAQHRNQMVRFNNNIASYHSAADGVSGVQLL
jgi:predicted lipid-binding transport protein (Tim44 family)